MPGKKTPLYEVHEKIGARMVEFHGWLMPVQYHGLVEEHKSVRKNAGLFDVSHMGEFLVFGKKAARLVNHVVTNDVSKLGDGKCMYTPMCRENGTIIDDLLVYKHNKDHYMLVVNASNIEKDYDWIKSAISEFPGEGDDKGVELRDVSDSTAMIALQGPKAVEILQRVTEYDLSKIGRFSFDEDVMIGDIKALVSRTGYTGEDGFEIYVNSSEAIDVWDRIIEAGHVDVEPAGLGARDTLRLEAGLMLYGNDIDDTTTPLEATIGWTVKLDKKDFVGRRALAKQKKQGVKRKMVGFEMIEKGIPRSKYKIEFDGRGIGYVTSGTHSPTLDKGIGLGYVKPEYSRLGIIFDVIIRDKAHKARVVELPFYRK
ncbi:MAG: glycine cleavage system aminomethyltransferase GcvT [Candidatus Altiarchaeota archaeon]